MADLNAPLARLRIPMHTANTGRAVALCSGAVLLLFLAGREAQVRRAHTVPHVARVVECQPSRHRAVVHAPHRSVWAVAVGADGACPDPTCAGVGRVYLDLGEQALFGRLARHRCASRFTTVTVPSARVMMTERSVILTVACSPLARR